MAGVGRYGSRQVPWVTARPREQRGGMAGGPCPPAQLREASGEATRAFALQISQPGGGGGRGEQRNLSHGPSS